MRSRKFSSHMCFAEIARALANLGNRIYGRYTYVPLTTDTTLVSFSWYSQAYLTDCAKFRISCSITHYTISCTSWICPIWGLKLHQCSWRLSCTCLCALSVSICNCNQGCFSHQKDLSPVPTIYRFHFGRLQLLQFSRLELWQKTVFSNKSVSMVIIDSIDLWACHSTPCYFQIHFRSNTSDLDEAYFMCPQAAQYEQNDKDLDAAIMIYKHDRLCKVHFNKPWSFPLQPLLSVNAQASAVLETSHNEHEAWPDCTRIAQQAAAAFFSWKGNSRI